MKRLLAGNKAKPLLIYCILFSNCLILQAQFAVRDSSFNGTGFLSGSFSDFSLQDEGKITLRSAYYDLSNFDFLNSIKRIYNDGRIDSSFCDSGIYKFSPGFTSGISKIAINGKKYFLNTEAGEYALYSLRTDGPFDSSFGVNGRVAIKFNPDTFKISTYEFQADGKIILGGSKIGFNTSTCSYFFIARLNTDGSIDKRFGTEGYTTTSFNIRVDVPDDSRIYDNQAFIASLKQQSDGKIITTGGVSIWLNGYSNDSIAMARYTADGKLDSSFNNTGKLTLLPDISDFQQFGGSGGARSQQLQLQSDNKIVVVASAYAAQSHGVWFYSILTLVRFNPDGSLDNQFGQFGIATAPVAPYSKPLHLKIQSDGKIFVCATTGTGRDGEMGTKVVFVRFTASGLTEYSYFAFEDIDVPSFQYETNFYFDLAFNRIYLLSQHKDTTGLWVFKTDGIPMEPYTKTVCMAGSSKLDAGIIGEPYQWQESSDGINYSNLSDNASYDGTKSSTLILKMPNSNAEGNKFRCLTSSSVSNVVTIHILQSDEAEWTGAVSDDWNEPGNWMCNVLPTAQSKVFVKKGKVKIKSNTTIGSLHAGAAATIEVMPGKTFAINLVN